MYRTISIAALVMAMPVLLTACATTSSVTQAPATQGTSRVFDGNYDTVKAAALQAVERMNVNVKGTDENAERFQIEFTKKVSAFSWGEVGVVNVLPGTGDRTTVVVNSAKRSTMQITGTAESEFAEEIFKNVEESLAAL
ncbi:hypothetical protein KCG44_01160 [Pacificimonas sp. WHA3]|uniref:Lipoprotein n=1 Tax=Pacificimonas pallii TaxID=2827236 RepID=A0ABS6SAN4_9SPHN|nr:hypothetical protein [Pacificimonas pallii]MBV7255385.1 hypothetical protein [Pacificimonas pallii]